MFIMAGSLISLMLGLYVGKWCGIHRAAWIVLCRNHSLPPDIRYGLYDEIQAGKKPIWVDGGPNGQWTTKDRDAVRFSQQHGL